MSAAATARPIATPQRTPGQAATALMHSLEPGETWSWCFVDEVAMQLPEVQGETRIPPSPLGG